VSGDDEQMAYIGPKLANRLPWQRTFELEHEDFTAFGADGISYARLFLNITANQSKHRWLWAVSVKHQFNETGSAESRQESASQATASYWRQVVKAEFSAAEKLAKRSVERADMGPSPHDV
jgi:hypothetical protein